MKPVLAALALAALGGCAVHQEDVARRMPWPVAPPTELAAYAQPNTDFPSVGGDVLKGASADSIMAARRAVGDPIGPPPQRPVVITPRAPLNP